MIVGIKWHPDAGSEFDADIDWYDGREFGVGTTQFEEAVLGAVDDCAETPRRGLLGRAGIAKRWCGQGVDASTAESDDDVEDEPRPVVKKASSQPPSAEVVAGTSRLTLVILPASSIHNQTDQSSSQDVSSAG